MWILLALFGCGPPTICTGETDAFAVVNDFWGTLDRRYASFDLRLANQTWDEVGLEACEAVTVDRSDDGVFDALLDMARSLNDGNVRIEAGTRSGDGWVTAWPHYDTAQTVVDVVEAEYVDSAMRRRNDDAFAWGRIGDVGYVAITRIDQFDGPDTESLDVEIARAAMDAVIADLDRTRALIVDIRMNEGGWDRVSLEIARHFEGPAAVAWSATQRNGPEHDDFRRFRDVSVASSDSTAYAAPVVVLTSGGTFGAAESFVLAMRVRDDVRVVGERTSGHFSHVYEGELPNGWAFTWSGDRYRAADGVVYEGSGLPPDVEVRFDPAALADSRDPQIEAALALLGEP